MPAVPGAPVRAADRPVRVSLTASSPDGPQYFRGRVPDAATPGTAPARVVFEAQPGKIQLRLSVEGPDAEVLDSEVRDLTIPDLTAPQTMFGTPELYRARSIPELQRLKAEAEPVPVAAREFSRTDRLLLRVPVHGPGTGTPTVTARLLNRAGQTMSELPVSAPDATRSVAQLELALANLSAGDYGIAVTAAGDGGDANELIAFRVTP
jgi:hypothetical protein